ncbi:flagellin N-terminal helical domain-containing protein [Vampirovibrio chlorellavorus]|uniref:flagellin N-terminal helical domain-containing protein n=1 Tax=Vampirovibrio chlorellavorus TaxID=758823 RepID=UPI0026F11417|nr:flagellin [Vampirovibrio chlorellavorus]
MSLVPNTNITSLIAQRRLGTNSTKLKQSLERLSSGYRINRAADDAAGLTISENLMSSIRRMNQASRNTQDGISVLQTAEGSLGIIGDNLQRVRELTIQAANDTNDAVARQSISNEIKSLLSDIDRIAAATNLNGINLLDGSTTSAPVQIGPNSDAATNVLDISSALTDASSDGLGIVGSAPATFLSIAAIDLSSSAAATSFLTDVDAALSALNVQRARVGSFQNNLESVSSNLEQGVENFSASNSRIRDVDIAAETAQMTQSQILTEAATTVLSQTNQLPRLILSLLQRQ